MTLDLKAYIISIYPTGVYRRRDNMKKVKLLKDRCDSSPFCAAKRVCPVSAIEFKKTGLFSGNIVINEEKCVGCGKCINACPHGALKI